MFQNKSWFPCRMVFEVESWKFGVGFSTGVHPPQIGLPILKALESPSSLTSQSKMVAVNVKSSETVKLLFFSIIVYL